MNPPARLAADGFESDGMHALMTVGRKGYLVFFACALLIRAARDLLIPFFLSASYVLGRFTEGPCFLPGMDTSRRVIPLGKTPTCRTHSALPGPARQALSKPCQGL